MARTKMKGKQPGYPPKLPLPSITTGHAQRRNTHPAEHGQPRRLPQQQPPAFQHRAATEPLAGLADALNYAVALLGMIAPTLLRPVAAHNIAAMQEQRYQDIILPNIQDVQQLLLHRESRRP